MYLSLRPTLLPSYRSSLAASLCTRTGRYTQTQEVRWQGSPGVHLLGYGGLTLRLESLDYCQPAVSKIDLYVTVVLNVVTDAYLLSIPLPVSCYLHIHFSQHGLFPQKQGNADLIQPDAVESEYAKEKEVFPYCDIQRRYFCYDGRSAEVCSHPYGGYNNPVLWSSQH